MKKTLPLLLLLLTCLACGGQTVTSSLDSGGAPVPTTMDFGMDSGIQDFSAVQGVESCGELLRTELRAHAIDAAALFNGTTDLDLESVLAGFANSAVVSELNICSIVFSQIYASIGEGYTPERIAAVAANRVRLAIDRGAYRAALVWSLVQYLVLHPTSAESD